MSEGVVRGYLGIDNGTQGLSIVFTDEELNVLATGEGSYGMVEGLDDGCNEQRAEDWDGAIQSAMEEIRQEYPHMEVLGIGISGQMHGEVCVDRNGHVIGTVRLWCDGRNGPEGHELTKLFQTKVARRSTCARYLWTIRNQPQKAAATHHLTTPAGWIGYQLTNQWILGIGDASGMFPMNPTTNNYDETLLQAFDDLVSQTHPGMPSLGSILPRVGVVGSHTDAMVLSKRGAALLGIPYRPGIAVAPPEGDQPAALAGSLIAQAGTVSMSFGTSIVANTVADPQRPFTGVHDGVDHFCAADGKPIYMIWIQNGTTFFNSMVQLHSASSSTTPDFATVMPQLLESPPDCGGVLALPFLHDEPGVGVHQSGTALVGLTLENATPGNVTKAALLAPTFNLLKGTMVLDQQGVARTEIVLSGGIAKTPECGQIVANVFNVPLRVLESGEEGSAWGGAVLAKYQRIRMMAEEEEEEHTSGWVDFCQQLQQKKGGKGRRFEPNPKAVEEYKTTFERYQRLLQIQASLASV